MKPYQHTVQYYETDRMGITHHSNYIRWMEEARVDFLAQLGWNLERLEAMGAVSPVTALDVKYRHDTKFPEVHRDSPEAALCDAQSVGCGGVRGKLGALLPGPGGAHPAPA